MSDSPRLDEQAIALAAQAGLSSQLDAAENIDIDIRTDLLKVVQGQADSIDISGQGLVLQEDIRVREMELHLDNVAIDPISALFGQIELTHPVDAIAKLVLTQEDLNRTLGCDYIQNRMQKLELNVDGQIVTITMQQLELLLPSKGKIVVNGSALLAEMGNTRQVGFSAVIRPRTPQQPILIESFECQDGQNISLELAVALLGKMQQLTRSPFIELEKIALRVKELAVETGKLTLYTEAQVREIPQT
jgi:LmeA-like phospholipid-binding